MKTITTLCLTLFCVLSQAQTVTTVTEGSFYDGFGITSNGDVYCSNFQGNEVFKYEFTTGNVTTFATGFTNPNGIGVTDDDRIYICEAGGGTIHIYHTDGSLLDTVTGLNNPTGIKYNIQDDNLLWVSYNQSSLNYLDPDDNETGIIIQGAPLNGPSGIAFIGDQTYISNYNDRKIFRLESDETLTEIAQLPAGAAQNNVLGFLTSKGGFLYGTQIGEHRIYRIDPETGGVFLFAGSTLGNTDGDIDTATFNFPNGILGDTTNDRIYISDAGSANLRIIENVSLSVNAFAKADTSIQLFPNMQNDSITIKGTLINAQNYELNVYNTSGQLIETVVGVIQEGELLTTLMTSTWGKGVYLIKINAEETVVTKRFIKR
ncbi:T9SS type A sorting domain-containing protein [uncultured Dokdonia sp.]|uniref:T9SS type A sorting domain-containing protein n=1 Tax=uncultured Dokdonia sp. TaxID=575653 RepID=UPI00260E4F49|nr:T9SS type A sorting domain-containing protein [uncultured Dokdonia sp.]